MIHGPPHQICGDFFDQAALDTSDRIGGTIAPYLSDAELSCVDTLTPLLGKCTGIFMSMFLHLFGRATQLQGIQRTVALLSPLAGSCIFGLQIGGWGDTPGGLYTGTSEEQYKHTMATFTPNEWRQTWIEAFKVRDIPESDIDVHIQYFPINLDGDKAQICRWTIIKK